MGLGARNSLLNLGMVLIWIQEFFELVLWKIALNLSAWRTLLMILPVAV